ncbi:hypothetical protein DY468_03460 [Rhodopseudomonas sp. BR0M22]|nr:hypothetical protein [Rhodopseudomonas sp. BR0M22]
MAVVVDVWAGMQSGSAWLRENLKEHSLEQPTAETGRGLTIVAAGSDRSRVPRKSIAVPLLQWLGAVALVFTSER